MGMTSMISHSNLSGQKTLQGIRPYLCPEEDNASGYGVYTTQGL